MARLQLGNLYVPDSFVMALETTPVAVCVALISTPGINAPVASDTVPLKVALITCANAFALKSKKQATAATLKDRPLIHHLR
jgi:hypothetical protein